MALKLDCFMYIFFEDNCEEIDCGPESGNEVGQDVGQGRALAEPRADALLQPPEDGALMASYSVFVVEPGAHVGQFF
jgi:hypothetical protein